MQGLLLGGNQIFSLWSLSIKVQKPISLRQMTQPTEEKPQHTHYIPAPGRPSPLPTLPSPLRTGQLREGGTLWRWSGTWWGRLRGEGELFPGHRTTGLTDWAQKHVLHSAQLPSPSEPQVPEEWTRSSTVSVRCLGNMNIDIVMD